MKRFSGWLAIGGAIGISLFVAGCQSKESDAVAAQPSVPKPEAPKKPTTYSDFTLVKQPDDKSTPRRGGYPPIVLGVPQAMLAFSADAKGTPSATPKSLGTAKIVDDAGHVADLGAISPPGKGETETNLVLTRGFSWKWSHPKLEITIPGQAAKSLPMKDLPEPETVDLPAPTAPAGTICESVPNLAAYGIVPTDSSKKPMAGPGMLLASPGLLPESLSGQSCQVILQDTQSAQGLGFNFLDAASAPGLSQGTKFVPFRFAEATSKIRIAVRKTNSILETQDVQFPGCKLVQKFNATGFEVDKDVTVAGSNGWSFTLKAQYDGPKREPRKDSRSLKIELVINEPKPAEDTQEQGAAGGGGGRRRGGNRALANLRRQDQERMKGSPTIELASPTLEELGLRNLYLGGHNYANPKADGPVKYGDFTLHLKIHTITVKELSTDTMVLNVSKTSRKPAK